MSRPLFAILCSGQGAQHPGMFDLFADAPAAAPVFAAAAAVLGEDPVAFVRRDGAPIHDNVPAQILCCTQALAAMRTIASGDGRLVIAGYSVGELAAWGCAGALDDGAVLRLARLRAEAMDRAAPANHGLAGLVGLRRGVLEPILGTAGAAIAIVNGEDSFVVGGARAALDEVCARAAAAGATRTVILPVAVPSHTAWLAAAVEPFRVALDAEGPRLPGGRIRLLSGLDGRTVWTLADGVLKLAAQIAQPIDWAACLESCRSAGAEIALELGPGGALARMAQAYFPPGAARTTADFATLDGLNAWLARSGG
ncbi:acyltransferase domain-containing protein [Segnochrobactrum spirostomi]|uniref:acyltransferase domain-containing protein n=1 Tax=Segnochrobactrum spirostomi TaxID=2608987 RepID=UPI0028ACCD4F|nr:acyltransferase domain-containing protein [Segnochrobactrum spirostomi]